MLVFEDLTAMIIERYNLDCGHWNNYSIQWIFCASPPTYRCLDRVPTQFNSWNNDNCFHHCLCHSFVLSVITSHTPFSPTLSNSWSNGKPSRIVVSHPSCQWVLLCLIGSVDQGLNWNSELIGKIDGYPHSLLVKCSDNVSVRLEKKLDKDIKDEQHLELTQNEW